MARLTNLLLEVSIAPGDAAMGVTDKCPRAVMGYHVNNIMSKSSSRDQYIAKSNTSGKRDFTGENTLGHETLCFFRVMWLLGSPK